jgi:hypothetical protein
MDVGGIFAVFVVTTIVEIVFAWVNSRGKTESSDERAVQQQIASLQKEKNGVSRTRYCALLFIPFLVQLDLVSEFVKVSKIERNILKLQKQRTAMGGESWCISELHFVTYEICR